MSKRTPEQKRREARAYNARARARRIRDVASAIAEQRPCADTPRGLTIRLVEVVTQQLRLFHTADLPPLDRLAIHNAIDAAAERAKLALSNCNQRCRDVHRAHERARAAIEAEQRHLALDALGLDHGATDLEIKSTYRRLAGELHPDHGGSAAAMAAVNAAYSILIGSDNGNHETR